MATTLYPQPSPELAHKRRDLTPDVQTAFEAFSRQVFADGALDAKTKQLIAVAVAHVTQCPYCIQGHTKAAQRAGATAQELMEAVWLLPRCGPERPMRMPRSCSPPCPRIGKQDSAAGHKAVR
jgi:AhpD family alkylhydroperoxidase